MDVTFSMKEFADKARQMGVFRADQLPFAISKTINDTMFQDVRPQIIGPTWHSAFTTRNSGLPGAAINVIKPYASKANLSGGVHDALHKTDLAQHAEGGDKTHAGTLAIPNRTVIKLGAKGKTPWARELEKKYPKHMAGGHLVPSVIKTAKGLFVGEDGRLRLFFSFSQRAHLGKRFKFYEDFRTKATSGMARHYPGNIQQAVATAFKR